MDRAGGANFEYLSVVFACRMTSVISVCDDDVGEKLTFRLVLIVHYLM
jgi:hypothetical protein